MKKITIITDFKFWELNSGSKNRTYNFIKYLDTYFKMNIVFLDYVKSDVLNDVETLHLQSDFFSLNSIKGNEKLSSVVYEAELKNFTDAKLIKKLYTFLENNPTDIIINTNIRTHSYMQNLPYKVVSIIDLHDLMYLRNSSFKQHNVHTPIQLSKKREFEILNTYDYILAIQEVEYNICLDFFDASKVLLVPHATDVVSLYHTKASITSIGFIATDNPSNLASIEWFLTKVWIYHNNFSSLELNIYGSIVKRFASRNLPYVNLIGKVDDLQSIYKENDIMINPVRFGSGLKIKNVEALSYGIPLVTTDIGAEGMFDGKDNAYLIANTSKEWCKTLAALSMSEKLRNLLSKNAMEYANKKFSAEACYNGLRKLLKSL
jgi:glycosyltransferase involved in cell wall biosynthesis